MTRCLSSLLGTLTTLGCVGGAVAQSWIPIGPPPRFGHCLGYARGRVWLLGGAFNYSANAQKDLWEYDGTRWTEQTPLLYVGPRPRMYAAMAQSLTLGRLVMFGGSLSDAAATALAETWEFDGLAWQQRTPASSPPARVAHAMVEDTFRGRIVLFGGFDQNLAMLGDTWEYDGTNWTQRQPTLSPPANAWHSMVFDFASGTTLSYGGVDNRLWAYDGVTWHQVVTLTRPNRTQQPPMWFDGNRGTVMLLDSTTAAAPARTLELRNSDWIVLNTTNVPSCRVSPIVYDPSRGRAVLFGGAAADGLRADTWEFDGVDWSFVPSASHGLQLRELAVAYDSGRGRSVVLGAPTQGSVPTSTFEWDGSTWLQRSTSVSPTVTGGQQMAYDSRRRRVVMFGSGPAALPDTWEYDGVAWAPTFHSIGQSPGWRHDHAMAYDSRRGRIVMFGGIGPTVYADTWEYDGTRWYQGAVGPAARWMHAMAYDVSRGRMVMFGGRAAVGPDLAETWLYDGTWQQVSTVAPGRRGHTMVYEPSHGRVALFGGVIGGQSPTTDLLEFDGTQWIPQALSLQSPQLPVMSDLMHRYYAITHDARRGRLVLLGPGVLEFEPAPVAAWATYGPGCALGSNPSLALAGATTAGPSLGSTFAVALTTTPSQPSIALLAFGAGLDRWNGTPLPIDLDALGGPGCQLWVPADDSVLALLPNGTATVSLPVPADPQLSGVTFGMQAVLADAGATNLFGGVSNAIVLRVQ